MKKIAFFLFVFFNTVSVLTAQEQEILLDTITIKEDTLYFRTQIIAVENGTYYPDTTKLNLFLGDSLQAATTLYNASWDKANKWSGLMRRAFQRNDLRDEYDSLEELFEQVTSKTLLLENQEQQFAFYKGRYRISALESSPFFVNMIQLGSGALRMEREDDGTRYNFKPRNRNFFTVTISGSTYLMHFAGNNPNGLRQYEEELKATGTRTILITKL